MSQFFKTQLLLVALLVVMPVRAVVVEDLFSVALPVPDQTTSVRLDAFRQAFELVTIKISGSDDPLQSRAFKNALAKSDRFVKQFKYLLQKQDEGDEFEAGQLILRVDFDQRLLEGLLRDNDFPIWGKERPGSLIVASYDVNERIKLISDDTTPDIVTLLDQKAQTYGVPLLFPLMDLEDLALVDVSNIIAREYESIEMLSDRYAPDAVIVGQITGRSGSGWFGDWEVRFADQIFKWKHKASSKDDVVDQTVRHLARVLAFEFALDNHKNKNQKLLVRVDSVYGLKGLIALQQYFSRLNIIDRVRVSLISSDSVTLELSLRNKIEDLQRLIDIGDVLEEVDYPQVNIQGGSQVLLSYSYTGRGQPN
ncbi:MAG: hypothetical protein ACI845_001375 [Gammaproteobacteria bacterium]|jgi:hypothetical protein